MSGEMNLRWYENKCPAIPAMDDPIINDFVLNLKMSFPRDFDATSSSRIDLRTRPNGELTIWVAIR